MHGWVWAEKKTVSVLIKREL